jgi:uncharacterized spore protein YtfJ
MENADAKELINTMLTGLDGLVNTKTVVGEPVKVGDATLVPLIEVSVGMGAGGFAQKSESKLKKDGATAAGGLHSKITPTAVLVLQRGNTKLIHIKDQDTMSKLIDTVPDLIDRFTGGNRITKDAEDAATDMLENK